MGSWVSKEALAAVAGEEVISFPDSRGRSRDYLDVNFSGLASKGPFQIRGNGALVLTRTSLSFVRLAPRWRFHVPLKRIAGVEVVAAWSGRVVLGRPHVVVHFLDEEGHQDGVGWIVVTGNAEVVASTIREAAELGPAVGR